MIRADNDTGVREYLDILHLHDTLDLSKASKHNEGEREREKDTHTEKERDKERKTERKKGREKGSWLYEKMTGREEEQVL